MKISLKVWMDVYPAYYWGRFVAFLKASRYYVWLHIPEIHFWAHRTEIFGKPQRGFHFTITKR